MRDLSSKTNKWGLTSKYSKQYVSIFPKNRNKQIRFLVMMAHPPAPSWRWIPFFSITNRCGEVTACSTTSFHPFFGNLQTTVTDGVFPGSTRDVNFFKVSIFSGLCWWTSSQDYEIGNHSKVWKDEMIKVVFSPVSEWFSAMKPKTLQQALGKPKPLATKKNTPKNRETAPWRNNWSNWNIQTSSTKGIKSTSKSPLEAAWIVKVLDCAKLRVTSGLISLGKWL